MALALAGPASAQADPLGAVNRGVEAREAGRWGEALSHFEAAVAVAPTWTIANLELAQALLHTEGDLARVGQLLERVRVIEADNPRLHYLTGLLREEQRLPAQAAAAYEQALVHRPSLTDARVRLGRLLLGEGKAADAVTHLEEALSRRPDALAVRASLAEAYEKAGRLEDAETTYVAIANRFPENPYHLHRLARFYERNDMTTKAKAVRDRASGAKPPPDRPPMRPLPRSRR